MRIDTLLRSQQVLSEEPIDFAQLFEASYAELPSITVILTHSSEAEVSLQPVEYVKIAFVLNDAEFRNDLITDFDRWISLDSDEEASFSIDKPNNPIRIEVHRDCELLYDWCSAYRL